MPRSTTRRWAVAGVVLALGAGAAPPASAGTPTPGASATTVVAAFYPLAHAAAMVGGRYVHVRNLTPSGVEPHDLELTPTQVDALQDARLAVVMGRGFQPAVERVAAKRDGRTIRVLPSVAIGPRDARVGEAATVRGNHPLDPHVWLDPVLMRDIVDRIEVALAKIDRQHAAQFATNARALAARLEQLDNEYRVGLAQCRRRLVVTAHEAFGYLAARYDLQQEGIAGLAPDAEPNPRRLAELVDLVERKGVTTIFTERLVSARVADTLAREAGGLRTAVLDPLEGLTAEQSARGDDYVSIMQGNLAKLVAALDCVSP